MKLILTTDLTQQSLVPLKWIHHMDTDDTHVRVVHIIESDDMRTAKSRLDEELALFYAMNLSLDREVFESFEYSFHRSTKQKVSDQIIGVAEQEKADIVCISTHGTKSPINLAMGSTTYNLIAKAEIQMCIVPVMYAPDEARDVLLHLQDYGQFDAAMKDKALGLASSLDMRCAVAHVDLAHNPYIAERMEALKAEHSDVQLEWHILPGNRFYEAVDVFVKNNGVDIIFLKGQRQTFWQSMFTRSKADQLLAHLSQPVWLSV